MCSRGILLLFTAGLLAAAPRFEIRHTRPAPVDGRLLIVIATKAQPEPRFQVGWDVSTAEVFGVDVDNWKTGDPIRIDQKTEGYPLVSLKDLKPGAYSVQAVLNV